MWYIYTMEYYSAIKRNETMSFTATWMDLEIIILKSEGEKQTSHDIIYTWNLKKKKGYKLPYCGTETDSQTLKNLWLPKGTVRGGEGWTGGLGLACAYWGIWNDWPMESAV